MLYSLHQLQRAYLDSVAAVADSMVEWLPAASPWARASRASWALLHRITKSYGKPRFDLPTTPAHGREVAVTEEIVATHPFCRLVRFTRRSDDAATASALARDPRILLCAPLSGHHSTLLRDTVATLLPDHDVYLTEWIDAREVPVTEGPFHLDEYVRCIQTFIRTLGAERLHVVAVCQPTVPVLAAISLLAAAGEATPRSLALMGGPVDARVNPTAVNKLATEHPIRWFETNMIHRVPGAFAGRGRPVYPGFMQLTAFVMMNPHRHAQAYERYWFDQLRGPDDTAAVRAHERFYDEYNAVLDMDAAYYLDTVRTVFQEFSLARGTWTIDGHLVTPAAISTTALITIEGALDDISGLGQTEAAHALCAGIPASRKQHVVAEGCGHYGLFSGQRWRTEIAPQLRTFIASHEAS